MRCQAHVRLTIFIGLMRSAHIQGQKLSDIDGSERHRSTQAAKTTAEPNAQKSTWLLAPSPNPNPAASAAGWRGCSCRGTRGG